MVRIAPFLFALMALAGGCNLHLCDVDGTSHCEGNNVVACGLGQQSLVGPDWVSSACPGDSTCVVVDSRALCAVGGKPVPECADAGTSVVCASNDIAHCDSGYSVMTLGCRAQGKVCVSPGRCGPRCADPSSIDMLAPCP